MITNFGYSLDYNNILGLIGQQVPLSSVGQPNGICPLNGLGKVDSSFLSIDVMEFKGVWNATTNTPTLVDGMGNTGDLYIVSVSGSQFTPTITFVSGDYCVYDGAKYRKVSGSSDTSLKIAANLSDLNNIATARTNLDVFSKSEVNALATPNPTNIYIDPVIGNDTTGNGSSVKPFQTLQHVLTLTTDNTKIYMLNMATGDYAGAPVNLQANVSIQGNNSNIQFDITVVPNGVTFMQPTYNNISCGNITFDLSPYTVGLPLFNQSSVGKLIKTDNGIGPYAIFMNDGFIGDMSVVGTFVLNNMTFIGTGQVETNGRVIIQNSVMGTSLTMDVGPNNLSFVASTFSGSITSIDATSSVSLDSISSGFGGVVNNATVIYVEQANTTSYVPTTAADWTANYGSVPTLVSTALDLIANAGTGGSVLSVTGDSNVVVDNTDPTNPTLSLGTVTTQQLGAYKPFNYIYNSPTVNGGQISSNASLVASTTQMTIGHLPANRGLVDGNYVPTLFNIFKANYPFKMIVLNYATGDRATMSINSFLGSGVDSETFSVSYIVGETTMTNFPSNGTGIFVFFDKFGGATTASAVSADNTGNAYLTGTTVQAQLDDTETTLSTLSNITRTTLQNSSFEGLRFTGTDNLILTHNAFGSTTVRYGRIGNGWDSQCAIFANFKKKLMNYSATGQRRGIYMALRIEGTGYTSPLDNASIFLGFGTESSYNVIQSWLTSDFNASHGWLWSFSVNDAYKNMGMRMSNATANPAFIGVQAGGLTTETTPRSGNTTNNDYAQGDIAIISFNPATYQYNLDWRKVGNLTVSYAGGVWPPAPVTHLSINHYLDNIIPFFSQYGHDSSSDLYDLTVLSQRECDSLGIVVSGCDNYFY